jgi:hypothetical protein
MEWVEFLKPNAAGLTLAAAAIVAGAPLFSAGMRALRLRQQFGRLELRRLRERPGGFAQVRGRVALESPLFSPLSATPCAGFQLDIIAEGLALQRTVGVRRAFRLEDDGASALVGAQSARWLVSASAERDLPATQTPTEGLRALLQRVPEALWWRRAGGTLKLVEHALAAGAECHVVGTIRTVAAAAAEVEWARTGTDDGATAHPSAAVAADDDPELWIGLDNHLDFLLVSDQPPGDHDLHVPRYRALGLLVGPALSMGGLLYLASVADYLRSMGQF